MRVGVRSRGQQGPQRHPTSEEASVSLPKGQGPTLTDLTLEGRRGLGKKSGAHRGESWRENTSVVVLSLPPTLLSSKEELESWGVTAGSWPGRGEAGLHTCAQLEHSWNSSV